MRNFLLTAVLSGCVVDETVQATLAPATTPVVVQEVDPPLPEDPAKAQLGAVAIDFVLESADGLFRLSDHQGDVILLELSGFG